MCGCVWEAGRRGTVASRAELERVARSGAMALAAAGTTTPATAARGAVETRKEEQIRATAADGGSSTTNDVNLGVSAPGGTSGAGVGGG